MYKEISIHQGIVLYGDGDSYEIEHGYKLASDTKLIEVHYNNIKFHFKDPKTDATEGMNRMSAATNGISKTIESQSCSLQDKIYDAYHYLSKHNADDIDIKWKRTNGGKPLSHKDKKAKFERYTDSINELWLFRSSHEDPDFARMITNELQSQSS